MGNETDCETACLDEVGKAAVVSDLDTALGLIEQAQGTVENVKPDSDSDHNLSRLASELEAEIESLEDEWNVEQH